MIPPVPTADERVVQFRRLLAYEIDRILSDLAGRRVLLLEVWGRHRERGPFLDTLQSRWMTLGFPELALIDARVLGLVERFYRELSDFRLYVSYTQDMPSTLADRYDVVVERLERVGRPAIDVLGGVDLPAALEHASDPALRIGMPVAPAAVIEELPSSPSVIEVIYEEIEMNSIAAAADSGFPPSPAQLMETDEERDARVNWRKKGKSFE